MKNLYSWAIIPVVLLLVGYSNFFVHTKAVSNSGLDALQGAWERSYFNEMGDLVQLCAILQDSFLVEAQYNKDLRRFIRTLGGTFSATDEVLTLSLKFDSEDNKNVGAKWGMKYKIDGDNLEFIDMGTKWTRINYGRGKESLANAWFFSGRMRDGEMQKRALGARKTLKMMSDSRFQWIAYNDETGEFFGTGGGNYTAIDGKYTENIEFFSRDSSRVGASLSFDFELKDEEWHHKGFSSKGDPMYEVWAPIHKIMRE